MARVLLVEDEVPLREALGAYLRREGLIVDEAGDGESAWRQFRLTQPDLVILDRKLPGLSGEDLCRRIKGLSSVPVLMATSLIQEDAALEAFALGADDYVRKPYSVRELTARVLARLRSPQGTGPSGRTRVEDPALDLVLDKGSGRAQLRGRELVLTPHEFDLLAHLLAHPGQVFSRQDLLASVWTDNEEVSDRTVDAHVKNLRAKLKAGGVEAPLSTLYGKGYRWS